MKTLYVLAGVAVALTLYELAVRLTANKELNVNEEARIMRIKQIGRIGYED